MVYRTTPNPKGAKTWPILTQPTVIPPPWVLHQGTVVDFLLELHNM